MSKHDTAIAHMIHKKVKDDPTYLSLSYGETDVVVLFMWALIELGIGI